VHFLVIVGGVEKLAIGRMCNVADVGTVGFDNLRPQLGECASGSGEREAVKLGATALVPNVDEVRRRVHLNGPEPAINAGWAYAAGIRQSACGAYLERPNVPRPAAAAGVGNPYETVIAGDGSGDTGPEVEVGDVRK